MSSVADVQARFHDPHTDLSADPTRRLLKQGTISRQAKFKTVSRECFLFNDCFVFSATDKKVGDQLIMKQVIYFSQSSLEESKYKANSLDLVSPDRRFTITFKIAEEAQEWLGALKSACDSCPKEEIDVKSGELVPQKPVIKTLHEACLANNVESVSEFMWKRDLDINEKDNDGNTPLHIVAQLAGANAVLKILLEHNADLSVVNAGGLTPLHLCAKQGNLCMLNPLLNSRDVRDVFDREGHTAIHSCVVKGTNDVEAMLKALIDLGGDVNETDDVGATLLHLVSQADNLEAITMLLEQGASLMNVCKKGRSPLHYAAMADASVAIEALLSQGAGPNTRDHQMNTPLHLTPGIVSAEILVNSGGRTDLKNIHDSPACATFDNDEMVMSTLIEAVGAFKELPSTQTDNSELKTKEDWVEDSASDCCLLCNDSFTFKRRRHHCRRCGFLVCGACSTKKYSAEENGKESEFRCCDGCYNVLRYKYHQRVNALVSKPAPTKSNQITTVRPATTTASYSTDDQAVLARRAERQRKKADQDAKRAEEIKQLQGENSNKRAALKNQDKKREKDKQSRSAASDTKALMQENKNLLIKRGEQLKQMEDKADAVENEASNFGAMASKLKAKAKAGYL